VGSRNGIRSRAELLIPCPALRRSARIFHNSEGEFSPPTGRVLAEMFRCGWLFHVETARGLAWRYLKAPQQSAFKKAIATFVLSVISAEQI
jgi:hypothetical protein